MLLSLAVIAPGRIPYVEAKPVTFAYQTPTLNSTLSLIVGVDFGFFAAEGLEVKTVFIRGGPTAIAALVGGNVDYTLVAGVPAVRAILQGAPLTIVSGIQPYMDYTLIGAKGISQPNDLKGKIVGVTGAGGIAEYAAVEGLAKKGLVRDRDYKVLYGVGNSPSRAQALEAGRIQASPFSFLERLELEQKGFPVLFDIGKVLPGFPFRRDSRRKTQSRSRPRERRGFTARDETRSRFSQEQQGESRRRGDQERNFWRSCNDTQDSLPVFRGVLSANH